jgi:hypothetical protein
VGAFEVVDWPVSCGFMGLAVGWDLEGDAVLFDADAAVALDNDLADVDADGAWFDAPCFAGGFVLEARGLEMGFVGGDSGGVTSAGFGGSTTGSVSASGSSVTVDVDT